MGEWRAANGANQHYGVNATDPLTFGGMALLPRAPRFWPAGAQRGGLQRPIP
ncbi:MAG: hypothetical protein J2P21_01685 [Chloracidobacterium sp.]|nr:hypothetical protein [Chloracidobacterium sp.]